MREALHVGQAFAMSEYAVPDTGGWRSHSRIRYLVGQNQELTQLAHAKLNLFTKTKERKVGTDRTMVVQVRRPTS